MMAEIMEGLTASDKATVMYLLEVLFPAFESAANRGSYFGPSFWDRWTAEKRVASPLYFHRYFAYAVPGRDIADREIDQFLQDAASQRREDLAQQIEEYVRSRRPDRWLAKMVARQAAVPIAAFRPLAEALSLVGTSFPRPENPLAVATSFIRATSLMRQLWRGIPDVRERFEAALYVASHGAPLEFAVRCFYPGMPDAEDPSLNWQTLFTEEERRHVDQALGQRVKELAGQAALPLYTQFPYDAAAMFQLWARATSPDEVKAYVAAMLAANPTSIDDLLYSYNTTRIEWSGSGTLNKQSFEEGEYAALAKVLDTNLIMQTIETLYGEQIRRRHELTGITRGQLLAAQFYDIHNGSPNTV